MMKTSMIVLLCCSLLIPAMSLADTMGPIEYNTDRNGSDYSNFELPDHVPQLCRDACLNDPNCMAWTLVRPGITGPKAHCWLKNAVPKAVSNPDCISGIKSLSGPAPKDEGIGTKRQELLSATPTTLHPEVGHFFNTQGRGCTATLISNRHFLTAAHCVDYLPFSQGGLINFDIPGQPLTLQVDRTFSQGGRIGQDDIAVGRLALPTNKSITLPTPARISDRQPSQGEYLTVMGYGCTDRDTKAGSGTKRYIEYVHSGAGVKHLCPGDSGGPVFLGRLSSSGPIIRVNSGYRTGLYDTDKGADAVRYRNEILSLVHAMEEDGVCYRAHIQGRGWMPAVCNGDVSGTAGKQLRMEAIQIWSPRSGVSVCYKAHLQDKGWTPEVCDGVMAGTTGESRRLEALQIRLKTSNGEKIIYQGHVQDRGWQKEVTGGTNAFAGTTGEKRRLEAVRIRLQP
jgi:hypothetical protein